MNCLSLGVPQDLPIKDILSLFVNHVRWIFKETTNIYKVQLDSTNPSDYPERYAVDQSDNQSNNFK